MEAEKLKVQMMVWIEEQKKKDLQLYCVQAGKTQSQVVIDAIDEKLRFSLKKKNEVLNHENNDRSRNELSDELSEDPDGSGCDIGSAVSGNAEETRESFGEREKDVGGDEVLK